MKDPVKHRFNSHNNSLRRRFPLFTDNLEEVGGIDMHQAEEIVRNNSEKKRNYIENFDLRKREIEDNCRQHTVFFKSVLREFVTESEIMVLEIQGECLIKRDPVIESDYWGGIVTKLKGFYNMHQMYAYYNIV